MFELHSKKWINGLIIITNVEKIVIQYLHFAFQINEIIINVTNKSNSFSNLKSVEN